MSPGLTLRTKWPATRGNGIVLSVRAVDEKILCTVLTEYGLEFEKELQYIKRCYDYGPVVNLDKWMKDHYNKVSESYERYLAR